MPKPQINPYAVAAVDEDDDYYRTQFKFPFNQPPPPGATNITDYRKLDGLVPPFSGIESEFQSWMSLFIPVVHRARCPVAWKAVTLYKCMSKTDSTLRSIMDGAGATPQDYARIINRLVNTYAHPEGLLASRARDLHNIKQVHQKDYQQMEDWLNKLESFMDTATLVGRRNDIYSSQFYEENLARMDENMAHAFLDWADYRNLQLHAPTLAMWLERRVADARTVRRGRKQPEVANVQLYAGHREPPQQQEVSQPSQGASARPRYACPLDGQAHGLAVCDNFKAMAPQERRMKMREWKRCYACLQTGHNIKACSKAVTCTKCDKYHHTLLHNSRLPRNTAARRHHAYAADANVDEEWTDDSDIEEVHNHTSYKVSANHKVALQTIPVDVYNGTRKTTLNCLMDQGATGAFMSKRAAEVLAATGHAAVSTVTGFGGKITTEVVTIVDLQISAVGSGRKHWIQVQVSQDPAASYKPHDWAKTKSKFKHLKHLPLPHPVQDKGVDLMLGMNTPELITSVLPDVVGERHEPIARLTVLGWVVGGPTGEPGEDNRSNFVFRASPWTPPTWNEQNPWFSHSFATHTPDARDLPKTGRSKDDDLGQLLVRMWEIDRAAAVGTPNLQDEKLFQFLRDNITLDNNKYCLPTLWKEPDSRPRNNYNYALSRLMALWRSKTMKDEVVARLYNEQLQDWLASNYVYQVTSDNLANDNAYYLPHFSVVRWDKQSTKVRVVMDGAARPGKNPSLNDCLKKGPKLVNELTTVLLRFRRREVCIAADIRQMFFQIKMTNADQDYHRFLWLHEDNSVKAYKWAVHPFGSAASPCVAIFAIKEHARKWKEEFPQAAETVIRSTLVDDNLDSCATVQQAVQLGRQLVSLFHKAGMQLGKIVSNSREVLQAFPQDMVAQSMDVAEFCAADLQLPTVKTLGVIYISRDDTFTFKMNPPPPQIWTKRTILRWEATLYDVHGLISPHTIKARMILQLLWREGLGWDEEITGEPAEQWQQWLRASESLPKIRVPRAITTNSSATGHLHTFCDASSTAYAAVTYFVTVFDVRLVCSKARVAPVKATSIPRLELLGAELAVELVNAVVEALDVDLARRHFWTDSTNVLCWILSESRTLNTFVANRVAKITEDAPANLWKWTPTDLNPADIPSRGLTADKLHNNQLWWQGPVFLKGNVGQWPQQPDLGQIPKEAQAEIRKGLSFKAAATNTQINKKTDSYCADEDPWRRLQAASWSKLNKIMQIIWSWRLRRHHDHPSVSKKAEHTIIHSMQNTAFAKTSETCRLGHVVPSTCNIRDLRPFADQDGLLRTEGGLRLHTHLPYQQRHPLILPADHPWTRLLLLETHRLLLHQGPRHVLATIRRKYWLVKATAVARNTLASCLECRRQRPRRQHQKMGPAIDERLPDSRCHPFFSTVLDMAGPFYVTTITKELAKHYFVLFTCATYRAVHLEPLTNSSAQEFFMALQRFSARRGVPQTLRADNGSNFVAVSADLRKMWQNLPNYKNIRWVFNPPKAPHMTGLCERMIGAAKRALYHVIRPNRCATTTQFHTALTVVEGILNTRPISTASQDVRDMEPLTPAHFLAIPPYRQLAPKPGDGWGLRTEWRSLQQTLDDLWAKFCTELQDDIQLQKKWHKRETNLEVDDLVVVLDKKVRGVWPLGRIIRTEPSRDGLVRRVQVQVKGTTVRRAAHSVILLIPAAKRQEKEEKVSL